ncbi:hypothetical protein [uncultured Roseibium sp.]|uniref:hypothetical protein n=1 Tax=uncultured Roseibium sp. TaxID=1936171 RepID=UPI00262A94F8|nr:hypothetical protein [uncultured Roseibium sp.]
MSDFALDWAILQNIKSGRARDVLLTLAEAHSDGGLCLPTAEVGRRAGMNHYATVTALWDLRDAGLIHAEGIGGLMSVELGCDFQLEGVE